MSPEHLNDIFELCGATKEGEKGFRELPQKTTLSFYLAKNAVGLTVANVEAIALRGTQVQARTTKGDLYVIALDDIFAVNIEGRAQAKSVRRAGFSPE